jgi:uncharacterized protein
MSKEVPNNRLARAGSAYLQSAANQAVDWYPWGPEAFDRARREDKPILLDIGARWCHWCHVIDRESYDNAEIAAAINENFIPVKVDRDAQPDVDRHFQSVVQAISGSGGWPLTAFLTPDGKVFFGGTYFPPEDRMGRPGFRSLLPRIAAAYRDHRVEVEASANDLHRQIAEYERSQWRAEALSDRIVDAIADGIEARFDRVHGGLGDAPKFPAASAVDLALALAGRGDQRLLPFARTTLTAQARGGIFDQLAGGFHRYSVDARWVVPHFEKMAYDNAAAIRNFVWASKVADSPLYREIADRTVAWVRQVLLDRERGGFYASQDADITLEDDGDYFTWTQAEARAALTAEEASVVLPYYDIGVTGEMHENPAKNVLFIARPIEQIAAEIGVSPERARELFSSGRQRLAAARDRRTAPYVDTALYTNLNGMMIQALLEYDAVAADEAARKDALRSLDRILRETFDSKEGFRHAIGEAASTPIFEDQAWMLAALVAGFEATGRGDLLEAARKTAGIMTLLFEDSAGGFYDAPSRPDGGRPETSARKSFEDAPTASANAVAALALDRLSRLTGDIAPREAAERTLRAAAGTLASYGPFGAAYGRAVLEHLHPAPEIVIVGRPESGTYADLHRAALAAGLPGTLVIPAGIADAPALSEAARQMAQALPAGAAAAAFICGEGRCAPPVIEADRLPPALEEFRRNEGHAR